MKLFASALNNLIDNRIFGFFGDRGEILAHLCTGANIPVVAVLTSFIAQLGFLLY